MKGFNMKVSEIFGPTVQGEGVRTGVLSVWLRTASCNLRCQGFFQKDPSDERTYIDPLNGVDPKQYKTLNDLPVVEVGCDTIYAIDPRFKHLFKDYSVSDVVNEIRSLLPDGKWKHPITNNDIDFCITGGEPLLWQKEIAKICDELNPVFIQIETNGTKELLPEFKKWYRHGSFFLFWNISPKLYYVSGESDDKAWKPKVISELFELSNNGCLKFVINDDDRAWKELDTKVKELKQLGVDLPVYLMPVGSTYEQQTNVDVLSKIATRAVNNGYHLSSRLQSIFWSNTVGV